MQLMDFEELVDRFVEQYLVPRGLPKDIFGFDDYIKYFGIEMPNGIVVRSGNYPWNFDCWYQPDWRWYQGVRFQPDQLCDIDSLLDELAKQLIQKKK